VLTPNNGDRTGVPNWVITIIAGPSSNPSEAANQAYYIRQVSNTILFAVGIGTTVSQGELVSLASSTSDVFQFNYSDLISGFAEKFVCNNLVIPGKKLSNMTLFNLVNTGKKLTNVTSFNIVITGKKLANMILFNGNNLRIG